MKRTRNALVPAVALLLWSASSGALQDNRPLMGDSRFVVDTEDAVRVYLFDGNCAELAKAAGDQGFVSADNIDNYTHKISQSPDCKIKGESKAYLGRNKAKKDAEMSSFEVPKGTWVIAGKELTGVAGLLNKVKAVPLAVCRAVDRSYVLQTSKSEGARALLGRSLGYGLKCAKPLS